jgi:hypothetical protein
MSVSRLGRLAARPTGRAVLLVWSLSGYFLDGRRRRGVGSTLGIVMMRILTATTSMSGRRP